MNSWDLRLWRKPECLRLTEDEEERVNAAHRRFERIVKLRVRVTVFSQLLHTLVCPRAQIVEPAEDDRFGRANFCACWWEAALLAIITERAFEGATRVGQWLRTAINNTKRTRHD